MDYKMIFLDVDGVINCDKTQEMCEKYCGIDGELLKNLATLVKEAKKAGPVSIVLTSTWADNWYPSYGDKDWNDVYANYLDGKLAEVGLHAVDKIASVTDYYRGWQIDQYLKAHQEITHYVILDDEPFDMEKRPSLKKHFVNTTMANGFTEQYITYALDILKIEREWF